MISWVLSGVDIEGDGTLTVMARASALSAGWLCGRLQAVLPPPAFTAEGLCITGWRDVIYAECFKWAHITPRASAGGARGDLHKHRPNREFDLSPSPLWPRIFHREGHRLGTVALPRPQGTEPCLSSTSRHR